MKRPRVRLLILAFVMAQIIRLFFVGWTREGSWIFAVDVLILLLIFGEDLLKFLVWCKGRWHTRQQYKILTEILAPLDDSLADAVRDYILRGMRPHDVMGTTLYTKLRSGSSTATTRDGNGRKRRCLS